MESITVQKVAADRVKSAADALVLAVASTPEDKLHWKPLDMGRPVLNQAIECVFANMRWTAIIRSRAFADVPDDVTQEIKASFRAEIEGGSWSGATVKSQILRSASELAQAILEVPDCDLVLLVTLPEPWSTNYFLVECFNNPYWNMVYHLGQINYIQTLLGDKLDHSVF